MATAGNAQVAIAWTASTGATSYHVKRGTASAGPFTQISAPTSTAFTDAGRDERHDLFLRRVRAELRRRKRQLDRRPARSRPLRRNRIPTAIANSPGSNRARRHRRQRTNFSHLGDQLRRHELSRQTQHHHRRPLHASLRADDKHLHQHQPHQRHKIFLRRLRAELRAAKAPIPRSQRHSRPRRPQIKLPTSPSRLIPQTQNPSRPTSTA